MLSIGTKCDSYEKIVDLPTAMEFARGHEIPLFEVSAKEGTDVEKSYQILISMLLNDINDRTENNANSILLPTNDSQPKVATQNCCRIM